MKTDPETTRPRPSCIVPFEVQDEIDVDEWQAIVDACPHATFFHTPAWLQAFAAADPAARMIARVFRFQDGKTAVFPILERSRWAGLWRSEASSAASCYGGWVSNAPLSAGQAAAVTRSILRTARNMAWRINPFDPHQVQLEPHAAIPDTTEILDLQDFGDEQSLLRHYRHSVRKQINKARRAGLTARPAETWNEWEAYYRIYEGRLELWGRQATSRYPIGLFRAFYETRSPKVCLWVVARDHQIVGGNLNLYQGHHCVEWHAAYEPDSFSLGVRDFLVHWIIEDARSRGVFYYDFNPSGGHEGTRRFKKTFGTDSHPSSLILVRRGIFQIESLRQAVRKTRVLRAGLRRHRPGSQATPESG